MRCVRTHDQLTLELKRARCKISNKGYLSLNIFVILCHNTLSDKPKEAILFLLFDFLPRTQIKNEVLISSMKSPTDHHDLFPSYFPI